MISKIKEFNFTNCQHLRKLLIDEGVEFKGRIDLKDTAIEEKNDVYKTRKSFGAPNKFENIPPGLTTLKSNFGRFKLKGKSIETQTEPVEIVPLDSTLLTEKEKSLLGTMKECLFWYDEFEKPERIPYLVEKQQELRNNINITTTIPLNQNVKLLGEHILLILEKLIENAEHFAELKKEEKLALEPRSWLAFYLWLISDMVWKYDERFWQWRTTSDLVEKLVYGKINRVLYRSPSDDKTGSDRMTLHKNLISFMDSLHDTVYRLKGENAILPVYDDSKTFGELFQIKINDQALAVFRGIFEEWKKTAPLPNEATPALTAQELAIKNKELQTQLDKLRLLFNSSYPSWFNWIKKRIIDETDSKEQKYSIKEDKQKEYPNLTPGDFEALEKTINSGSISNEVNPDIIKSWAENVAADTKFLSITPGKAPYPLKTETYLEFGKIFDKWRSKLYMLNPMSGVSKEKEAGEADADLIQKLKDRVKELEKGAEEKKLNVELIKELEAQIKTKEVEKKQLALQRNNFQTQKSSLEKEISRLSAQEKELEINKNKIKQLEQIQQNYQTAQSKISSLELQLSQINSQLVVERTNNLNYQNNIRAVGEELARERAWVNDLARVGSPGYLTKIISSGHQIFTSFPGNGTINKPTFMQNNNLVPFGSMSFEGTLNELVSKVRNNYLNLYQNKGSIIQVTFNDEKNQNIKSKRGFF